MAATKPTRFSAARATACSAMPATICCCSIRRMPAGLASMAARAAATPSASPRRGANLTGADLAGLLTDVETIDFGQGGNGTISALTGEDIRTITGQTTGTFDLTLRIDADDSIDIQGTTGYNVSQQIPSWAEERSLTSTTTTGNLLGHVYYHPGRVRQGGPCGHGRKVRVPSVPLRRKPGMTPSSRAQRSNPAGRRSVSSHLPSRIPASQRPAQPWIASLRSQ
jgi:hypothetical protein